MKGGSWFSLEDSPHLARKAYVRGRRRNPEHRSTPRNPVVTLTRRETTEIFTGGYEPAEQILADILRSALDVTGAAQGFIIVSREGAVLEVASHCNIRPEEIMDASLRLAALPLHGALRENRPSAADSQGRALPIFDGYFETNDPAVLCLPLDLGLRQRGALCVLRQVGARKLSELDLEIVQALAEQAALAIGAACNHTALTRLEASLSASLNATPAFA